MSSNPRSTGAQPRATERALALLFALAACFAPARVSFAQRRTGLQPACRESLVERRFEEPRSVADSWYIFRCYEAADGNHTIRQFLCTTATCTPESCNELLLRPEFDENNVRSTRPVHHGECLTNGMGTNSSWAFACGTPVDHTYLKLKAIADAAWAKDAAATKGLETGSSDPAESNITETLPPYRIRVVGTALSPSQSPTEAVRPIVDGSSARASHAASHYSDPSYCSFLVTVLLSAVATSALSWPSHEGM